jgi:hypothetical protein
MAVTINGTTGITNPNGSAGAPAFTGQGSNTGLYFPTNTSVGLATGGIGRVITDSSGNTTLPYQPSFSVRVNNSSYISTSPVPWSLEIYDVGSNFNTSTYRFTAPTDGKYFFSVGMYLQCENSEDAYPRLRVNGVNSQYSYFYNVNTGSQIDVTVTCSAVFSLAVNDYVDVTFATTNAGRYYGGNTETVFYGYLLG